VREEKEAGERERAQARGGKEGERESERFCWPEFEFHPILQKLTAPSTLEKKHDYLVFFRFVLS